MRASLPRHVPVLVIGAGQAGLAAAWWLQERGLTPGRDLLVLDADADAGGAWQHRWPALRIGAAHRIAELPGMREAGLGFADAPRDRSASEVVVAQYRAYERFWRLDVRHGVRVDAVRRAPAPAADDVAGPARRSAAEQRAVTTRPHGEAPTVEGDATASGRFRVTGRDATGPVTLTADVIVNATGTWRSPFVPWYPGRDRFAGVQLHTHCWRDARRFTGMRVGVVGGGTSAVEHLAELDGVAASTVWFTRRPVHLVETDGLTTEAGIASVATMDRAARAGRPLPSVVSTTGLPHTGYMRGLIDRGALVSQPMFRRLGADGAVLSGGTTLPLDAIVWDTGFRPHLGHLAPLRLREPAGGVRVVDGVAVREPHLILAGHGPQASTITAAHAGRVNALAALRALSR